MVHSNGVSSVDQIQAAFDLFQALHDAPDAATAEDVVSWLRRGQSHVQAFDNALTLWAYAGAAMAHRPRGRNV